MSLRLDPTESTVITPGERAAEIASILARGILRLHGRCLPIATDIEIAADSSADRLELPAHSGPDGVGG